DSGPRVEGVVAERGEPLVHLAAQRLVERQPVLPRRDPEEAVVQRVEATELVDRALVVVDAQVADEIGEPCVAAVLLDDEERRRLLPAAIAACDLRGREAVDQPPREALSAVRLERVRERVDGLPADEDVPLRRVAAPRPVAGPLVASAAGVGRSPSVAVDDADLAFVAAVIRADETAHGLLGVGAFAQQCEAFRAVAWVRVRLGRDGADVRLGPRNDGADGQELRLHRDAPLPGVEVARGDGERRDDHPYVSSVRSSSSRSVRPGGTSAVATSGRRSAAFTSSGDAARTTTGVPASNA